MKKLFTLAFAVGFVAVFCFGITRAQMIDTAQASGRINVSAQSLNLLNLRLTAQDPWTKSLALPEMTFSNMVAGDTNFQLQNTPFASGSGCLIGETCYATEYSYTASIIPIGTQSQQEADQIAASINVIVFEDLNADGVYTQDEMKFGGTLYNLAYNPVGESPLAAGPDTVYDVKVEMQVMGSDPSLGSINYALNLQEVTH
jgi:hypothetical protein